jgi:hypothetical protein
LQDGNGFALDPLSHRTERRRKHDPANGVDEMAGREIASVAAAFDERRLLSRFQRMQDNSSGIPLIVGTPLGHRQQDGSSVRQYLRTVGPFLFLERDQLFRLSALGRDAPNAVPALAEDDAARILTHAIHRPA